MKKIFYITALLLLASCQNKSIGTAESTQHEFVDSVDMDWYNDYEQSKLRSTLDTDTIQIIDIDTIIVDGQTKYMLLCELKNEWDEIKIEGDTMISLDNYLIPINLKNVIIK